jgi:hypothetical protein
MRIRNPGWYLATQKEDIRVWKREEKLVNDDFSVIYLFYDTKGRIYHLTALITRFIHYFSVLRICDILVRIQIQLRAPAIFVSDLQDGNKQKGLLLFEATFTSFFRDKKP